MNYSQTAIKGVSWYSGLRLIMRLFIFVKIAVLARILLPSQFGEFGVATIVLGLLEIFTETGINIFLLQEKTDPVMYLNTAWAISIIRGVLISLLIFISAAFVVSFFHIPALITLFYLISVVPLIRGFINPMVIKFQKNLQYKNEFLYRLTIITVEIVTTVFIAILTHSVFSFAWGLIISALVEVILSHALIKPRPSFSYDSSQARTILHRGKWITGFGILDYVYTQGDNAVVGRLMDQTSLGVYQNAYKISALPMTEIGEVFYKVTFPIFVQLINYPRRLKIAAIKSATVLLVVLFVTCLSLFFLASPLVHLALGPNWTAAIPVIKILAFLGFFRGLSYSFNPLFLALQQQKKVTYITAASAAGLLLTIVPLVYKFGIVGAAYSAMFGSVLALPIGIYLTLRSLHQLT